METNEFKKLNLEDKKNYLKEADNRWSETIKEKQEKENNTYENIVKQTLYIKISIAISVLSLLITIICLFKK